ncbi:hypothetical protein HPB50_003929 [Hyalomma asiaticum]|uniref:Uncharacterized protein n=1 Tax=Hyalomma asiaticum TaxID=266040 RepID=A0ACB7T5K8_HYAAI|nr:hypothetical protein HPB50_003929 [Hyalomma asiaticum]
MLSVELPLDFDVSGTSPANCAAVTCDPATCQDVQCTCGSYKDQCGCCDVCYKCHNEVCSSLTPDPCTEGYHCVLDRPDERFDVGTTGHCKHRNETATAHHHAKN